MKLSTLFFGMLFLFSILSCNSATELSNNFTENKTFSAHETEQLLTMLSAFDEAI